MRLPLAVRRVIAIGLRPVPIRIREGPNEGCRWSLAASGRHAAGRFERGRIELIRSLVSERDCVWDVGAHHGYVTLAVSRLVGPRGRVYAFEPSPYNLGFLRTHVRWNEAQNVVVVPVAVGGRAGFARFGGRGSSQTFRLGTGRDLVETVTIGDLLSSGVEPPDLLKVDIEGAEGDVFEAAAPHLPPAAVAIVSIHSRQNYERVVRALAEPGFEILESSGVRRLRTRADWGLNDPDILAIGPGRKSLLDRARRLDYFVDEV